MKQANGFRFLAAGALAVLIAAGCSDSGISRSEVDDAIAEALEGLERAPDPQAVTAADLEDAVTDAIAEHGAQALTVDDVEDIVDRALQRMASAAAVEPGPAEKDSAAESAEMAELRRNSPAEYTRHVVDSAIAMYDEVGLDATLAYVNDPANIDGQWYVIVVGADGEVIGHYESERRGLLLSGWVGTDINGYNFGHQMLAADQNGRWVPFVYKNPATGSLSDEQAFELKNTWVVRHDGLLLASGWHIDSDSFLPEFIAESSSHFREGGLDAILGFYNNPTGISAGLIPVAAYYNSTDTLDGYFTGIIAAPDGEILAHFDDSLIGTDIEDLIGPAYRKATTEGAWITADDNDTAEGVPESMRIWAVNVDGTFIGAGWYRLPAS